MIAAEAERRVAKYATPVESNRVPHVRLAWASFSEIQTTSITRAALESLIDQIPDLQMEWNDGDPIIIRKPPVGMAPTGRKLNDVRGEWRAEATALSDAVAKIAAGAEATIDQMVKEAIKAPMPDVLRIQGIPGIHKQADESVLRKEVERVARAKAKENEKRAREVLKAQGASDADIDAAADLLRMPQSTDVA
jgi:hypothetical protein